MISPRALGALYACVCLGIKPTREALQGYFKQGGKYAWDETTKELLEAGFLARKTYPVGNRRQTDCWITPLGIDYIRSSLGSENPTTEWGSIAVGKSDSLSLLSELTNTSSKLVNSIKNAGGPREEYIKVEVNVTEESQMSWDGLFESTASDDQLDARAQHQKFKKQQYQEAQKEKQTKKLVGRHAAPIAAWTPADIAYEFADRLLDKWNIQPWQVRGNRFVGALASMRKRLDTDGEIEYLMLDLFMQSIDFDKYDNAELLWRMFISRSPGLMAQARPMVKTEERVEEAAIQAQKSQEWLYE